MNLSVMHWNINNKRMKIHMPSMIFTEIESRKPDVLVLTEWLKTPNIFEFVNLLSELGYKCFIDEREAKPKIRQVFIAVKKEILYDDDYEQFTLCDNENNIFGNNVLRDGVEECFKKNKNQNPNFMAVRINICDEGQKIPLTIIGTRIRVICGGGKYERIFRNIQLNNLIANISGNENTVILGDFNISPVPIGKYSNEYWDYNVDFIKRFNELGMGVSTPNEKYSPFKSDKRMDHIITSKEIKVSKPSYDYSKDWPQGYNRPDHSILQAEILLPTVTTDVMCKN